MTVITLTIDLGSLDKTFPAQLANALGLRLVDQSQLDRRMAESTDTGDSIIRQFVRTSSAAGDWPITPQQLAFRLAEETLREAASGNTLIVGWSAAALLRPVGHGVHWRVTSPLAHRQRKVMSSLGYRHPGTAALEIASHDAAIGRYLRQTFHVEFEDPTLFDFVLDASTIPHARCLEMVRASARASWAGSGIDLRVAIERRLAAMRLLEAASLAGTRTGSSGQDTPASVPRFQASQ